MNILEQVTPKLLAQGLLMLRSQCVMPRLVNHDYDSIAQQKGSTVDIPLGAAVAVRDVVPAANNPHVPSLEPKSVALKLDQWKEAPFSLTDKDLKEAMNGYLPLQAGNAIGALAEHVNSYLLGMSVEVYNTSGAAGLPLFHNEKTTDAHQAAMILDLNFAPRADRRAVIDPISQASAMELRAFQDASWSGSTFGIKDGELNRKLGFDWFMNQGVKRYDTRYMSTVTVNGPHATKGATQVPYNETATGNPVPNVGTVFAISGNSQKYVVTSATTAHINCSPALVQNYINNSRITFTGTHTANLAFHKDAIAFATRPLQDQGAGLGNIIQSQVDPVSGLSLRLEISREHKQTRWSFDILYGAKVIRPEHCVRLLG